MHISKHNGYDCTVRCFNWSLESFPFLLSCIARLLIGNSPLVSCQVPEQNVLGLAFLMAPHFDGLDLLLRAIFPSFNLVSTDMQKSHSSHQKGKNLRFQQVKELLCLVTDNQLSKEDITPWSSFKA